MNIEGQLIPLPPPKQQRILQKLGRRMVVQKNMILAKFKSSFDRSQSLIFFYQAVPGSRLFARLRVVS